jgi:4-amino-4-deoxy-L-arabinose transferase-like glycosyltransferase
MTKRKKNKTPQQAQPVRRPWMNHLLIIVGVGFLFRLIYDLQLPDSLFFGKYFLDSLVLHNWALDIFRGHSPDMAFFRAPLYPYIVAFLYRLFGDSPWPVILFQHLCGLGTGIVMYFFARRLFNPKIALWTGLVTVAYPTLVYFEGELMIATLSVFLYTISAWLLYESIRTERLAALVGAGLAFGLSAITRPTILPLAAILPIALFIKEKKILQGRTLRLTAVFIVALFIPIIPVTLTNIISGGEFVLISTQGGVNFYIGNSKTADGITVTAPGPNARARKYSDNVWTSSVDEAEKRVGHQLTQSEVSSYWLKEGMNDVLSDPMHAIKLYFKKLYLFYHGQEIFNNKSMYYAGDYSLLMKLLLWKHVLNFPSGILIPLALVGMVFALVRGKEKLAALPIVFVVLFSLVIAAFFVCSRFRQPIMPLLIMFAVYGISHLDFRNRANLKWYALLLPLIVLLNLGGNVDSEANRSVLDATMGKMYLKAGEIDKGLATLRSAMMLKPDNLGIYDVLGQAYLEVRMVDSAESIYDRGLSLFPDSPEFNFGKGLVKQAENEPDSAVVYYRKVIAESPDYPPAHDRLGFLYMQRNELDSAIAQYEKLETLIGANERLRERIDSLKDAAGQADHD